MLLGVDEPTRHDFAQHTVRIVRKSHRKRGTFYLLCPDQTVRDEEQAFTDLRCACELSGWRDDLVRWVIALLTDNGDAPQANAIARELAARGSNSDGGVA